MPSASKYRRWTAKEDRLLKKLYNKKKLIELAVIFNRHWNKIARRAIRIGVKKDPKIFGREVSKTQKEQFKNGIRSNRGNKNPNWKGGNTLPYGGIEPTKYNAIHKWLRENFGAANECEGKNCTKISKVFQWAKVKGKTYRKLRNNFIMLCKSCHVKYDIK